jgi:purine-binding chemotaxis protein CheW
MNPSTKNDEISRIDEKDDERRFLVFSLSEEEYAIPLLKVKEVIALNEITPVPYSLPYFKGIMNLRGNVISIIDLRQKFNMKQIEKSQETAIIILDVGDLSFGMIVDSVNSVLATRLNEIQPPPDVETQMKSNSITGITRREKKLILILDVDRTLSLEDIKSIRSQTKEKAA